jgi:hypothetical protein
MSPGWALIGMVLCGVALSLHPAAACFAAAGAAILLVDRMNHTIGPILKLSIEVARSFTFRRDDQIERIQDLCKAIILWRKI